MHAEKLIVKELCEMNAEYDCLTGIYGKNGNLVYRVVCGDKSYILKYFMNDQDRREIENYHMLKSLGIKTVRLVSSTKSALLLEDIVRSNNYRLGIADDLNDIDVAKQIARWYKELHGKGKGFVSSYKESLYDETDVITTENIYFIRDKTSTESSPVWEALTDSYDLIRESVEKAEKTLTYNDFYYTNLVVAKDKSEAFMLDYNLLGKGYAYSDTRNVCWSLGEHAKAAFLEEYGGFNQEEIVLDNVVSPLVTLYFACMRKTFPEWAETCLAQVKDGRLLSSINVLKRAAGVL